MTQKEHYTPQEIKEWLLSHQTYIRPDDDKLAEISIMNYNKTISELVEELETITGTKKPTLPLQKPPLNRPIPQKITKYTSNQLKMLTRTDPFEKYIVHKLHEIIDVTNELWEDIGYD